MASVANPAVTGTIVLSSFPASVAFLSYATRPVTASSRLARTRGRRSSWPTPSLPASQLATGGCRTYSGDLPRPARPPSDGVELAPFLITAYSALRLELLPSQAPGEL